MHREFSSPWFREECCDRPCEIGHVNISNWRTAPLNLRIDKLGLVQASELIYCKWESGGGRIARQPGQVRKEAAVTRFFRVASPGSHP